jgi:tRNA G18 (ribose-2'-O)-methylase SpoU
MEASHCQTNDTGTDNIAMAAPPAPDKSPKLHLVICNICKATNVRSLLLSACAFGCHSVLVVGQNRNFGELPAPVQHQVNQGRLILERFDKWKDCVEHLSSRKIRLIGVEIDSTSVSLDEDYFQKQPLDSDTALIMGNEGEGIHLKQMKDCDAFVRIPQYGVGTASFNVTVACSLVLHRYHEERIRQLAL